jgi:hypothetical protein
VSVLCGTSRGTQVTRVGEQAQFVLSECHKCQFSCLESQPLNKRSICLKRCKVQSCREKTDALSPQSDSISHEHFEQLAHAAAIEIFEELTDSTALRNSIAKHDIACTKCKKACKKSTEEYKCYATCANKAFCRYEDNTIPVVV